MKLPNDKIFWKILVVLALGLALMLFSLYVELSA